MNYDEHVEETFDNDPDVSDNISKLNSNEIKLLRQDLWDQLLYLNNIGTDYIEDVRNKMDKETIVEFLTFINDHIIDIKNFESVIDDPKKMEITYYYIYRMISVDLLNIIIPMIINDNTDYHLDDLIRINHSVLRKDILDSLNNHLEKLNDINDKTKNSNKEMDKEILKYMFYIDIFDINLENFKEHIFDKIISKYELEIYSNLN